MQTNRQKIIGARNWSTNLKQQYEFEWLLTKGSFGWRKRKRENLPMLKKKKTQVR